MNKNHFKQDCPKAIFYFLLGILLFQFFPLALIETKEIYPTDSPKEIPQNIVFWKLKDLVGSKNGL
jgi:hypothetical protein